MRNVERTEEPKTLKRNSTKWTDELRQAIASGNSDRISKARKKYNKKEVREALKKMYKGLCCYCEGSIMEVSFGQIEHMKPIEHYPEEGFSWDNLHLACEVCNNRKSDKYDEQYPILDPTGEEIIKDHLSIRLCAHKGIEIDPETSRGTTTVEHTALNRDELCGARLEIANIAIKVANKLSTDGAEPINDIIKNELNKLKAGRYGSTIEEFMHV